MEHETGKPSTLDTQNIDNEVNSDVVNINQGGAKNVKARQVTMRMGGAQSVISDHLDVRQGGMMTAKTESLEMLQAGAGMIQTHTAHLTASTAGVVVSGGDAQLDQSGTRVLVARGDVTFDQGVSGITIANRVRMQNSGTIFLIARNVEGDVRPVFGPSESLLFGAVAGLVAGTVIMLSNLFRRKRK